MDANTLSLVNTLLILLIALLQFLLHHGTQTSDLQQLEQRLEEVEQRLQALQQRFIH